jgi:hypothetical protein
MFYSFDIELKNNLEYSLESAFYINEFSALVIVILYNSMPYEINYFPYNLVNTTFETFTVGSLFRYLLFENLKNIFFQRGNGSYKNHSGNKYFSKELL